MTTSHARAPRPPSPILVSLLLLLLLSPATGGLEEENQAKGGGTRGISNGDGRTTEQEGGEGEGSGGGGGGGGEGSGGGGGAEGDGGGSGGGEQVERGGKESMKGRTEREVMFRGVGEGVGVAGVLEGMGDVGEEPRITWGHANTNTAFFREDAPTNITAIVGHKAALPCHVVNLGKKEVSWIRQRDLHILTVGIYTYTSDDRFKVYHPEKSDQWYLEISSVTFRDAGVYECQVSASPKISLPIMLSVEVQQARIEGPAEVYIQKGSTIRLTCRVNTHSENVGAVTWYRDSHRLDYDSPRGGVSVEIEKTPSRTTSKLFITRALRVDGGNYTCVPQYADAASVQVHVVNGEESAAVHTAGSVSTHSDPRAVCVLLLLLLLCQR